MRVLEGWFHRTSDLPERGLEANRVATEEERAGLAAALDVLQVRHLRVRYRARAAAGQRYVVTGRLEAGVTQACIVTLEPVESEIAEDIDETFWPTEQVAALGAGAGETEALAADAPLPIEDDRIDIGRLVYEVMATALDPYPRRPDAAFDADAAGVGKRDSADHPFAALARLKDKT